MARPQITILVLMLIGLCFSSYMHGKEQTSKHNVVSTLISTAVLLFLLYMGGFFG